jgi:hypothetical protein
MPRSHGARSVLHGLAYWTQMPVERVSTGPRGDRASHSAREESTSEAAVGVTHELAEIVDLAGGLVQLAAAGVGLAAALALRRQVPGRRQRDDPGRRPDDDPRG